MASVPASVGHQERATTGRPVRRVLHVFHTLGMGGAETWLVAVLEWLERFGDGLPVDVQIDVCLTGGRRTVLDDRVAALGANIYYLRYRGAHLARFRREFIKVLRDGRYDAVHDHQDYAAGVHLLCGLGALPAARVVHVHNPFATFHGSMRKRLARAVGRRAVKSLATTVAGTSLEILHEYDLAPDPRSGQRRITMHCGVDLTRFEQDVRQARADVRSEFEWAADARVLLFVGRLESHFNQKNPRFALEIARACIARDPRVKALFVGAGDDARLEIERELADAGVGSDIRLAGIRFDVPRLMLAADLLLFPSIAEGLGMVAVEAQAAGLRVLASDTTPRECQVVPGMVTFASLTEPAARWAERALALLEVEAPNREDARASVARSTFSIASSVEALMQAYGFTARS